MGRNVPMLSDVLTCFIYLTYFNEPTGQTTRQILKRNGSNNADSRKECLLEGLDDTWPHLGDSAPKIPNIQE